MKLKIKDIRKGHNARAKLDPEEIDRLAASIGKAGLLQPPVVRKLLVPGKGEHYELVAGARRLAAAEKLGWEEIDVIEIESAGDEARDLASFAENAGRVDLTLLEFGREARRLKDTYHLSAKTIGSASGKSDQHVNNAIRVVTKIKPDILEAVEAHPEAAPRDRELIAWAGKSPEKQATLWAEWQGIDPEPGDSGGEPKSEEPADAPKKAQSRKAMLEYAEKLAASPQAGKAHVRAAIQAVRWCAGEIAQEPRYRA